MDFKRSTYRFKNKSKEFWKKLVASFKNKLVSYALLNGLIVVLQYIYLGLRFQYLNNQIPLWYTKLWGTYQLVPKENIYIIPFVSLVVTVFGLFLLLLMNRFFVRYLHFVITSMVTVVNIILSFSLLRIIFKASAPFPPLISPLYLSLIIPFGVALILSTILLPKFLELAHEYKLITIPKVHSHPAMLLKEPSARGGGVFYGVLFLLLSLVFIGFNKMYLGFYLAVLMLALLSIVDDFQNTHPTSDFRLIESPWLRLLFLFSVVSLVVFSGISIESVGTLTGPSNSLSSLLSMLVTSLWVVWVLNVLSWSNGIDGQYCGIVSIASLIIGILALRFTPLQPVHREAATMAAISAGVSLGFVKLTWYPSKIMWGFGATLAGLVISTLSILVSTKVVTSMLIILVPLTDALVTVIRRLIQGKNPLKGDKGHLHHLLMERGWSVGRIAVFYWFTTAIFGVIGLLSAEKYALQVGITAAGVVAFFITLLNVQFYKKR